MKQLPERPDLEHLKGQAKALLNSYRSGDPVALAQVGNLGEIKLSDAQRIVAREYGFASWPKLKAHVEGLTDRKTAFFKAIRGGDVRAVRRLLDADPELIRSRDQDSFGEVPIAAAANRGSRELIDLLLERGADIDARSDWWAGSFGALDLCDEETAAYLIRRGARLTAHSAARLGLADDLRRIIAANPEVVRERGGDGQYPLHFSKTPEIVDILVDAGGELDARDLDHVSTAAQWRIMEVDVCRRLMERGATPDVYIAIMLEDFPLLRSLIERDPACLSRTPLDEGNPMIPSAPGMPIYTYNISLGRPFQIAAKHSKHEAAKVIDEHSSEELRLMAACWRGDAEAARALSNVVSKLSMKDMSILAEAAWERMIAAVKLMLAIGFDPDAAGVHHSTPLDRATFHGFADVIEAILPYGPSLTVKNEFGGTPLGACVYGSLYSWRKDGDFPRSVRLLLEAGSPRPEKMRGSDQVNSVLREYGIETA